MQTWFQLGRIDPTAIVANTAVPFATAAAVQTWTAVPTEAPGSTPGAIIVGGRVFALDAADTTSAHDGSWVCVSADGKRYKAGDIGNLLSVKSRTTTAPPTLSASIYQQAWIVATAATGAWAGHDGEIAVATGRGWLFFVPQLGQPLYVEDAATYYHREASSWVAGLGAPSASTVKPTTLEWPFGLIVESRTLNTPPSGSTRKAYVVGSAPTGAWAAHANEIALGPLGGWEFIAAGDGSRVWCREESTDIRYVSGGWTSDAGSLPAIRRAADNASLTLSGASYTYAAATAPTTSNTGVETLSIAHAARAAGSVLRLRYRASIPAGGAAAVGTVALFVDASATAAQWLPVAVKTVADTLEVEFLVTAADAVSHTYYVRFGASTSPLTNRHFTLEEMRAVT